MIPPHRSAKGLVQKMKKTADELGWVIVGVDQFHQPKVEMNEYKELRAVLDDALDKFKVDEKKIAFAGFSYGGVQAFKATRWVETNAAGVICFGGYVWSESEPSKGATRMAVAMVNGDQDKGARENEANAIQYLKSKTRSEVKVFHFPGKHVVAPPDVCLKAAKWIEETKKF